MVYIARNPEMFLPLCDAAAKENRPAWTEKRLAYGAQCSWTERVHQMEEVLYKRAFCTKVQRSKIYLWAFTRIPKKAGKILALTS